MQQVKQISMPAHVFVEAVRLASEPCGYRQEGHAAVSHVTDWWNASAEPELRCAYGLALYVRYGEDWLSGDPEECWVSAATWARHAKPRAEATLLNGDVVIKFFKRPVDEDAYSYDSKAVDGSEGSSGGRWADYSGDEIITLDSHKMLNLVPLRFPEIWEQVCAQALHDVAGATGKSE